MQQSQCAFESTIPEHAARATAMSIASRTRGSLSARGDQVMCSQSVPLPRCDAMSISNLSYLCVANGFETDRLIRNLCCSRKHPSH